MKISDHKRTAALCAVFSLATMATASAEVIAGINLGSAGALTHLETGTFFTNFANNVGDASAAYGLISTVNGNSAYCADGTSSCSLYYVMNRTVIATPNASDLYFSGTQFTLFYSATPAINLLSQDSSANLSFINGLATWTTLSGTTGVDPTAAGLVADSRVSQSLNGATVSASGSGLLSVNVGDRAGGVPGVGALLNANSIPTFTGAFADVAFTESANNRVINPFDAASALGDTCATGAPQAGDWCFAGSLSQRGKTVGGSATGSTPQPNAGGPSSGNVVGGIDVGAAGTSIQIGTGTLASTFVNAVGDSSTTYGLVSTVNGDSTYCADGTSNCSLYYIMTKTVSATPSAADLYFGGTEFKLFYSPDAAIDLLSQDSNAILAFINGLETWATLEGENGVDPTAAGLTGDTRVLQTLNGATISTLGSGLLSVNTGDGLGMADVEAYLDQNPIPTFTGAFADIAFTHSDNNHVINPFDASSALGDTCATGAPQVGDWCFAGSFDERGLALLASEVPAPGSLALLVIGILGVIYSTRDGRRLTSRPH
jgi:hypothetical protein